MTADLVTITCTGCGRVLAAAPDDEALIAMEGWWEDEQDRTWCGGCDPDAPAPEGFWNDVEVLADRFAAGVRLQPVAEFPDGTTYSVPIPRDPWALLNRARYGCPACDQLIDHDDLTGDHQHTKHLAGFGLTAAGQGRRVAA